MRRALFLVACVLLLSGCDGRATTSVDVQGVGRADVTQTLTLTGEAAAAVLADPALDQRLLAFVAETTGGRVERREDEGSLSYRASTDVTRLKSGLGGVNALAVSADGSGLVSQVQLVRPTRLLDAIEKATAGAPDSKAMALAWKQSLTLELVMTFPGEIISVDAPGIAHRSEGSTFTVLTPVADWSAGTATIRSAAGGGLPIVPVSAVLAVLLAVGLLLRRRR